MKRILSAYLVVFGIHFLLKWNSRRYADVVTGSVVDIKTTRLAGKVGHGSTDFDYPIVRYELGDVRYTTSVVNGAIYSKDVREGDSVQIVVPANNVEMAVPDTFWCYWLRLPNGIILFFVATLLALLLYKFGEYVRKMNSSEE